MALFEPFRKKILSGNAQAGSVSSFFRPNRQQTLCIRDLYRYETEIETEVTM
jgi:hypothetical protein